MWGIAVKVCKGNKNKQIVEYDLDKIYSSKAASGYTDIRDLREDYDMDYNYGEAQKDGCLVVGAMVHNEDTLTSFIADYTNKETAFIRIVQRNAKSEVYIIDLFYDSNADVIYCITDKTRDSSIQDEEQKKIKLEKFEHMAEYAVYKNNEYWVLYNGDSLDYENIESKVESGDLYFVSRMN